MSRESPSTDRLDDLRFLKGIKVGQGAETWISYDFFVVETSEDLLEIERVWLVLWIANASHEARDPTMELVHA